MEIKAVQKFVLMSPRKLRIVAELVKDLSPADAFERLPYVKKRAAEPLRKVIGTAIANARQNNLSEGNLIFKEIQINDGPRLKRWRPGARGRAKPYKKRMSHIRIILTTQDEGKGSEGKIATTRKVVKEKAEDKRTLGRLNSVKNVGKRLRKGENTSKKKVTKKAVKKTTKKKS